MYQSPEQNQKELFQEFSFRQPKHIGSVATGYLLNERGEAMTTIEHNHESLNTNYLGRIKFGKGDINGEHVSEEDFIRHLDFVKNECLIFIPNLRELFGACMDGRNDKQTDAGNVVFTRPKVLGGPSAFGWYIAAYGQFKVLDGIKDPRDQFATIQRELHKRHVKLGMHYGCLGAEAVGPISETYVENIDNINQKIGQEARKLVESSNGHQLVDSIKEGIGRTHDRVAKIGNRFSEEFKIGVVSKIAGRDSVVHLEVDHADPVTHGHKEVGLVFSRVANVIVNKGKVNQETDLDLFYSNAAYAREIIAVLANDRNEFTKGIIIADQLPLAGVATLGQNQHVGEISGNILLAA